MTSLSQSAVDLMSRAGIRSIVMQPTVPCSTGPVTRRRFLESGVLAWASVAGFPAENSNVIQHLPSGPPSFEKWKAFSVAAECEIPEEDLRALGPVLDRIQRATRRALSGEFDLSEPIWRLEGPRIRR
jgi:hypothetical protein